MIDTLVRQLLLVALAALVIAIVVRVAFRPLGRLRAELDVRTAGDLSRSSRATHPAKWPHWSRA